MSTPKSIGRHFNSLHAKPASVTHPGESSKGADRASCLDDTKISTVNLGGTAPQTPSSPTRRHVVRKYPTKDKDSNSDSRTFPSPHSSIRSWSPRETSIQAIAIRHLAVLSMTVRLSKNRNSTGSGRGTCAGARTSNKHTTRSW